MKKFLALTLVLGLAAAALVTVNQAARAQDSVSAGSANFFFFLGFTSGRRDTFPPVSGS